MNNQPANTIALNPDGTVNMDILNQELAKAGHDGLYPPVSRMDNKTENFHSYEEAQQAIENRKAANRHNKASPIQANDTISDIINSDEYKQTLDYIYANDTAHRFDTDHSTSNTVITDNAYDEPAYNREKDLEEFKFGSKPANIATNEPKTEVIDMPAKPKNPNLLPQIQQATVRSNPQISTANILDGYVDSFTRKHQLQSIQEAYHMSHQPEPISTTETTDISFGEQWASDMISDDVLHGNHLQDKVTPVQDVDNHVSLNTGDNDMPASRLLNEPPTFAPMTPSTKQELQEKYAGYKLTEEDESWMSNEVLTDEQVAKIICSNEADQKEIDAEQAGKQDTDMPAYDLKSDFMFDHEYQITATGRQIDDISYACEKMARIEIGQINAFIDALPLKDDTDTYALLQQLEYLIKPHLKSNLPHSPFFTMHQSLRHRRSWDIHPEGGMTVNFDEPLILDPKTPLLKVALVEKELTQDIFIGLPDTILSAHIDENGLAFVNETTTDNLFVQDGQHISSELGKWQYPVGRGYKTVNWQASPINRTF